jgi:hypothetical protein
MIVRTAGMAVGTGGGQPSSSSSTLHTLLRVAIAVQVLAIFSHYSRFYQKTSAVRCFSSNVVRRTVQASASFFLFWGARCCGARERQQRQPSLPYRFHVNRRPLQAQLAVAQHPGRVIAVPVAKLRGF